MSGILPEVPSHADIEAEERRDRRRNRLLIGAVFLVCVGLALWVGSMINASQKDAAQADKATVQAQVEKYNLAQQVAAACADVTRESLDEETYNRLCTDARTIVREGPRGAQGIPGQQGPQGVQGVQGIPGADGADGKPGKDGEDGEDGAQGPPGPAGADGKDGAQGPQGPPGADGKDGAVGPAGPAGQDGQPPYSWVVYNEAGNVIESCIRTDPFDPKAPTYQCTR